MTHEQLKTYESQLKPCPFCGGKAEIYDEGHGAFSVACYNTRCLVTAIAHGSIESLVDKWNTRSSESKVLEDIRAEIMEEVNKAREYGDVETTVPLCIALDIIDKHIEGVNK